jgi:hypothetical protein
MDDAAPFLSSHLSYRVSSWCANQTFACASSVARFASNDEFAGESSLSGAPVSASSCE